MSDRLLLSPHSLQVLHCAAIIASNQDTAFMISIGWTALNMLMSNYILPFQDMSFQWISNAKWLSAMAYAWDALLQTEFRGRVFDCSAGIAPGDNIQWLPRLFPTNELIGSPFVLQTLSNPDPGCIADASVVPSFFGLFRPFGHAVGILLCYLVIVHAATFLALVNLTKKARK